MSLFTALEIASSGMSVQRTRMNVSSMNMANKNTTRSADGGPYRRRDVIVAAAPIDSGDFSSRIRNNISRHDEGFMGVKVQEVRTSDDAFQLHYDPGHPDANADGYVEYPNVDGIAEMMNIMGAARAYEAEATVMRTIKHMAEKAIKVGR